MKKIERNFKTHLLNKDEKFKRLQFENKVLRDNYKSAMTTKILDALADKVEAKVNELELNVTTSYYGFSMNNPDININSRNRVTINAGSVSFRISYERHLELMLNNDSFITSSMELLTQIVVKHCYAHYSIFLRSQIPEEDLELLESLDKIDYEYQEPRRYVKCDIF